MGIGPFIMDFWQKYYNSDDVVGGKNPQENVGRTKNGNPISDEDWNKSIKHIASQLNLKESDDILEVCCGNGMVIGELSKLCNSAYGIDYSDKLLKQLVKNYPNVECTWKDVLKYKYKPSIYDKVILYFSAQHFSEMNLLELIIKMSYTTKSGGSILIGDVPNESEKWNYISEPKHRYDYFTRISNRTPMIGNWYSKDWFLALNDYLPNVNVRVVEQPNFMINSDWRFDVIITKL